MKKEHLTVFGLHKIVAIKASINKGLSSELKAAFPNITPVPRPKVEEILIHDPYWFLGFIEAEGCFSIMILKSQTIKIGFSVSLRFQLTQHSRDIALMQNLRNFWDCGNIIEDSKQPIVDFKINKFSDIQDKVIPFFQKYPILGVKRLDYLDWCKVAELMQNKVHLTQEGIDEIKKIKSRMNTGRNFD